MIERVTTARRKCRLAPWVRSSQKKYDARWKRYDSMCDFIMWHERETTAGSIIHDATLNNKPRHHYFQLSAQIASDYFLSKGGTDDFRSWVSTNASPLLSLPVKIVNPPFLTYRPNVPPQSGTSIFFFLYRCLLSRDARLKKKNLLQLASLNIFPGMNYVQVSTVERHTHTLKYGVIYSFLFLFNSQKIFGQRGGT